MHPEFSSPYQQRMYELEQENQELRDKLAHYEQAFVILSSLLQVKTSRYIDTAITFLSEILSAF